MNRRCGRLETVSENLWNVVVANNVRLPGKKRWQMKKYLGECIKNKCYKSHKKEKSKRKDL